jgi:hypothetical protein
MVPIVAFGVDILQVAPCRFGIASPVSLADLLNMLF